MLIPRLADFTAPALFLLRLMLALVFASSGWSHLTSPRERAESIGMSVPFTAALGAGEVAAAVALVLGIFPQIAGLLLVLIMCGAVFKKAFVWHSGLWGDQGGGWYYDMLYLVGSLVVVTTGGGSWVLT